jgi:hypothetical protein
VVTSVTVVICPGIEDVAGKELETGPALEDASTDVYAGAELDSGLASLLLGIALLDESDEGA